MMHRMTHRACVACAVTFALVAVHRRLHRSQAGSALGWLGESAALCRQEGHFQLAHSAEIAASRAASPQPPPSSAEAEEDPQVSGTAQPRCCEAHQMQGSAGRGRRPQNASSPWPERAAVQIQRILNLLQTRQMPHTGVAAHEAVADSTPTDRQAADGSHPAADVDAPTWASLWGNELAKRD